MVGEGAREPGLRRTASLVGSRNQIPNLEDGEIVFCCAVWFCNVSQLLKYETL